MMPDLLSVCFLSVFLKCLSVSAFGSFSLKVESDIVMRTGTFLSDSRPVYCDVSVVLKELPVDKNTESSAALRYRPQ